MVIDVVVIKVIMVVCCRYPSCQKIPSLMRQGVERLICPMRYDHGGLNCLREWVSWWMVLLESMLLVERVSVVIVSARRLLFLLVMVLISMFSLLLCKFVVSGIGVEVESGGVAVDGEMWLLEIGCRVLFVCRF